MSQKHVLGIIPDKVNRARDDFYKTPPQGTRRLLAVEDFPGTTWEPACGDGAISRIMEETGHHVVSTDLVDRGYGRGGVNFLNCAPDHEFDNIVTNPPFTHAEEFARRALDLAPRKVAMLCRLLWLEGNARRKFFESTPLARVWVFSGRINVARDGTDYGDGGNGGMVAFAWYVWEKGYTGRPQLGWV